MVNRDADIIVVGAGPTGLMLAGELGLQGVSTLVVDQLVEPMRQSRALGFSARTIEEFDQRGLLPRLGEVGTIPFGHFGGVPIDYTVVEGGSYGARGIPQSLTEGMLAAWATEQGAEIRRGVEVTGVAADGDGVTVKVNTPDGPARLTASYVVGCDGGRSIVRKLAGIDFPGSEATLEMWLADVAGIDLRLRFSGERVPGGMVMVLPLGPHAKRVVVFERSRGIRGTQEPPTFEQVADTFQRLTGEDIHGAKPLWVSWFTDSSRQAAEYRQGRVLLAGDAAHVHLPIGGQGLSAGIGDAVNLGWKLAAVIKGRASEDLLDSYHTERHPVGAKVITNTLAQRTLYLSGDEMQPLREIFTELVGLDDARRSLIGMVTGLDITYEVGSGNHPLLGRRIPNLELVGQDGKGSTFERLHAARGLVLDLADDAALRKSVAGWADRVEVVTATPHETGALDGVRAVLVRPDGYIAWISADGCEAEDLTDALGRWFGQPNQDPK